MDPNTWRYKLLVIFLLALAPVTVFLLTVHTGRAGERRGASQAACTDRVVIIEARGQPLNELFALCSSMSQASIDMREVIPGRGSELVVVCICKEE